MTTKFKLLTTFAASLLLSGCAGEFIPDQITNPSDAACRANVQSALSTILKKQDDFKDASDQDMSEVTTGLTQYIFSNPRGYKEGFQVSSKKGSRYGFAFKSDRSNNCYLRLYGRSTGIFHYVNTITFIESEALPNCQCPRPK